MKLSSDLEALAVDTWERLRDSIELEVRFGEETISDLLLLDLKRASSNRTRIIQTPKSKEKVQGTDWEWWLGSPRIGWLRLAVQAKKLDLKTLRYNNLSHKVGRNLQIDLLERYSSRNRAIPMYCFYNYALPPATRSAWQCCESFDEPQLACTIAPARIVRQAINTWGARNFSWIHNHPQALPWRCLARCPKVHRRFAKPTRVAAALVDPDDLFDEIPYQYPELPGEVEAARESGRLEYFSADFYNPDEPTRPRRIVVLEFASTDEAEFSAG